MIVMTLLMSMLFIGLFALLFAFLFAGGALLIRVLYTFCIGFPIAICLGVAGMLLCITVIGIPVGLMLFRMAGFVLVPFR